MSLVQPETKRTIYLFYFSCCLELSYYTSSGILLFQINISIHHLYTIQGLMQLLAFVPLPFVKQAMGK